MESPIECTDHRFGDFVKTDSVDRTRWSPRLDFDVAIGEELYLIVGS